jgi:hypothetical protein
MQVNWYPDAKGLRIFSLACAGFLATLAAYLHLWRGITLATSGILLAVGIVVGLAGCLRSSSVRLLYLAMTAVALPIGWVISHVVLALAYYAVLLPLALIVRHFRTDPMRRELDEGASTYWVERRPHDEVWRYFRQF